MATTKVRPSTTAPSPSSTASPDPSDRQVIGGVAASHLSVALVAAIPYFLLVVDYPAAETAAAKVDLITGNYASMYAMSLAAYVAFGLAVGLVAFVLRDRLHERAPSTVRMATFVGLLPVALALGGAGGEILGGLWILLLNLVVVRRGGLPRRMGWLGVIIGVVGLVSVVPALADASVAFGLLEIVWFAWLGGVLLMGRSRPGSDHASATSI